jgi:hypothetical protein
MKNSSSGRPRLYTLPTRARTMFGPVYLAYFSAHIGRMFPCSRHFRLPDRNPQQATTSWKIPPKAEFVRSVTHGESSNVRDYKKISSIPFSFRKPSSYHHDHQERVRRPVTCLQRCFRLRICFRYRSRRTPAGNTSLEHGEILWAWYYAVSYR